MVGCRMYLELELSGLADRLNVEIQVFGISQVLT